MRIFAIIIALFALQGCATIIHGSTEDVAFDSSPAGAWMGIDGDTDIVRTPAIVSLARGHAHSIIFRMPAYEESTATLVPDLSGWIFGNMIFTPVLGIIGVLIDANDGAMYTLSANHVQATLMPLSAARLHEPLMLKCWKEGMEVTCP